MKVWRKLSDWLQFRHQLDSSQSIALVPTMGCLHPGHGSLIEQARAKSDCVVLSIFINPTQFNELSDFEAYPKTIENDIFLATKKGVDHLFLPSVNDMYPRGEVFAIETSHFMAEEMEGKARPGHFSGMLTVVMKLLNIIQPHQIFFGEKDFQQWHLVKAMIKEFFIPVDLVVIDTVRESFGLPMSSRNKRLTDSDWCVLRLIYQRLSVMNQFECDRVKVELEAMGVSIDYLLYVYNKIFIAFYINNIRLIDHFHPGELSC